MEPQALKNLFTGMYDLIDENIRLQMQSEQLFHELEILHKKSATEKNIPIQEKKTNIHDDLYKIGEEKIKDMIWPDLIDDYDITPSFVFEEGNLIVISFEKFLEKLFRSNYFDYEGVRLIGLISYPVFTNLFHNQLFHYYEELVSIALQKIASPKNNEEDEEENENDSDGDNTDNE